MICFASYITNETYRVYMGDVAPREGTMQISGMACAVAGGLTMAKLGTLAGAALGGPTAPITGPIGGIGGGIIGLCRGYFGGRAAANEIYDRFVFSDEEHAEEKIDILRSSRYNDGE